MTPRVSGIVLGDAWLTALGELVATASLVEHTATTLLARLVSSEPDLGRVGLIVRGEFATWTLDKIKFLATTDVADEAFAGELVAWGKAATKALGIRNEAAHSSWIFLTGQAPDGINTVGGYSAKRNAAAGFPMVTIQQWRKASRHLETLHASGLALADQMWSPRDEAPGATS